MYEVGDIVRLKEPVRGYTVFAIIKRNGYKWVGECSSGMEAEFYDDEIEEKV